MDINAHGVMEQSGNFYAMLVNDIDNQMASVVMDTNKRAEFMTLPAHQWTARK